MSEIIVHSRPGCVQCHATCRSLDERGIDYRVVDISADAHALERVRELGHAQAPVVTAGDDHWSGFRPDKIEQLAAEQGLDAAA